MRWLSDAALERLRGVSGPPPSSFPGGRYEILTEIGRGGMGTVYLARDRDLDREVAVKVLHAEADPALAARLLQEARILARLEHSGIVPIHDIGTLSDGRIFYAMRRVRGRPLDDYARTVPLPEILRAFERVLDAVAFAHARGVIHRDLKPENVLVGPFGDVLVMDWGVAKLRAGASAEGEELPAGAGEAPGETAHGTVLGTPGYLAPEQARGEVERTDERTDVYALGALLRTLLGGEAGLPVDLPRSLAGICARATAAAPADRYGSVVEMGKDLGRYLAGLPVGAYRVGLLERAVRLARRYRAAQ